jgi:hypothetical protein
MKFGGRAFAVVASGILLLAAGAARADSSPPKFEGFPPKDTKPIVAPVEKAKVPAPAVVVTAGVRVESSELGFDKGVAPAPGRTVNWQGSPHLVIEVAAVGGGTVFSGGSRHVIGVSGSQLMVALKFIDPDSTVGPGATAVALRQN